MKIEITREHDNYYTVRSGDRYQDGLCWDEMLGVIVRATFHGEQLERVLRTAEDHARSSYSSIGQERRREASYTALCGIKDRAIRLANELFGSNVEQRLIYLLSAVQNEEQLWLDPPEAETPAAPPVPEPMPAVALPEPVEAPAAAGPEPINMGAW